MRTHSMKRHPLRGRTAVLARPARRDPSERYGLADAPTIMPSRLQRVFEPVIRALAGPLANARPSGAPWLFAREMLSQPAAVGAVWPSSSRLARSVAAQVPRDGDGLVVELGGGTGAVTQALLQRGIASGRIVVIERSPVFVRHLRARFPGVCILQGDAAKLGTLLPRESRIDAVVSSLPLRSLPAPMASAIVAQWRALVGNGGLVVQFTYDLFGTDLTPLAGFLPRASDIVWANLPPARVLALEYRGCEPAMARKAIEVRSPS